MFVLGALLLSCLPAGADNSTEAQESLRAGDIFSSHAVDLLDTLRQQDRVLERWARQLVHPEGVAVDSDEVRRFIEALEHLDRRIRPLAEEHPDLVRKQQALLARADDVLAATSGTRTEDIALTTPDGPSRWLQVPDESYVTTAEAGSDVSQAKCDAAIPIGVEERALPGLDGSNELLLRFVAPSDGRYLFDTAGSRTDTTLVVIDGCRGTELARSDDESGLRARAQVNVAKGETVYLRVGSDRRGWVRLAVQQLTEGVGTASVSGTVTAAATGEPLQGIDLRLTLAGGGTVALATTDALGQYEFFGIAPGTYEAKTAEYAGDWINELWQEIQCGLSYFSCDSLSGTPVELAEGQALTEVDFTLSRPGILSGRVVDSVTGEPLGDVGISLYDESGSYAGSANTDAAGRYRVEEFEPGAVFLRTYASFHENEIYDDLPCMGSCDVDQGTPVVITEDGVVTGIDFALDPVSAIVGTVLDATTGDPVIYGEVYVYTESFQYVDFNYLDAEGRFWIPVPDNGSYYARTDFYPYEGYQDEVWQEVPCDDGCDLSLGDLIVVGQNEQVEIGFTVEPLGGMSGTIAASDAGGLGSDSSRVTLYDELANFVTSAYADQNGDYEFDRLLGGDYYAVAGNSAFRSEVWDGVPCAAGNACEPLLGTAIDVEFGQTTPGIDFDLDRLGIVEGRVTRQSAPIAIAGVTVELIDASPTFGESTSLAVASTDETDSDGEYRFEGVEPGSYYVLARSFLWQDEVYDDLPCEAGCDYAMADGVTSTMGTTESGIDFKLERTAWIEGHVTDAASGTGLAGRVRLFDSSGFYLYSDFSNSDGFYSFEGLDDGTYYVLTDMTDGYLNELHDGQLCELEEIGTSCDPTSIAPIVVSVENGATVDFELDLGGVILGAVQSIFGSDLGGQVYVYDDVGTLVRSVTKHSFEQDFRIEGLRTGDYRLLTGETGHRDELWPNVPCYGQPRPACDLSLGVEVAVAAGATVTGVDFSLEPLASISGVNVDAATGAPLMSGYTALYDSSGDYIATDYDGTFTFTGVGPGTYFLVSSNAPGYLRRVHGGELCDSSCDLTTGTPIAVDFGDDVSGVEIELIKGPGIWGRVIDGPTGDFVAGVSIDVWNLAGEHLTSAVSDASGRYELTMVGDPYYISTHNEDGFVDFVYDGVQCPGGSAWEGLCDPTAGTPYVIDEYTPLQRLDLYFGDVRIFRDGFESGDLTPWSSAVGAD